MGRLTTKINTPLFWGNEVPNTVFKFFPQETIIPSDLNPKNWFWGHIFLISVVLLGRLFPRTIKFTHEWIHTNHVNFMKIGFDLRKIEKKILNDCRKIMEGLLGKTEVIRNWCWCYEIILKRFFENGRKILKKFRKYFAQTFKKTFDGTIGQKSKKISRTPKKYLFFVVN